jgi:hypothetical protein
MFKDTIASGMQCLEKENIEVYTSPHSTALHVHIRNIKITNIPSISTSQARKTLPMDYQQYMGLVHSDKEVRVDNKNNEMTKTKEKQDTREERSAVIHSPMCVDKPV